MRRVWYQLVEASDDSSPPPPPAADASSAAADCASLNEGASLVVDLRDAVFPEISHALAAPVLPSNLCVYAFDKDKWQQLDPGEAIGTRGSSNVLAVVVPAHHLKRATKRHGTSKDYVPQKLFVEQDHGISIETARIVSDAIEPVTPGTEAGIESTYHSFWDALIAKVLRNVSSGSYRRNTNTSSSSSLYRPDLCFYYAKQNVCVFRGEEKAKGDMQAPIKELYDNLTWRYDNAPYVFGYAAVRYQVCLVVIRKDNANAKAEVIEHYELAAIDGRLSFLLALLNLSALFRPVVELIHPFSTPEYGAIVQTNGVEISFAQDWVIKEYPTDAKQRHR